MDFQTGVDRPDAVNKAGSELPVCRQFMLHMNGPPFFFYDIFNLTKTEVGFFLGLHGLSQPFQRLATLSSTSSQPILSPSPLSEFHCIGKERPKKKKKEKFNSPRVQEKDGTKQKRQGKEFLLARKSDRGSHLPPFHLPWNFL